jgi:uncharacterized membrane protein YbhN (UPF0104 family)
MLPAQDRSTRAPDAGGVPGAAVTSPFVPDEPNAADAGADVSTGSARRRLAGLSSVIGIAVAVAGLGFVGRTLVSNWDETVETLQEAQWGFLLLALPVCLAGMTAVGLPWRRALELMGGAASRQEILTWYFPGQLGKYVPGAIWPLVGRGELAVRGGVARPAAYGSVALSLVLTYLAATLTAIVLLPLALLAGDTDSTTLLVLAILPFGLVMLHPAVLQRVVAMAERVLSKEVGLPVPAWGDTVRLLLLHVPAWLLIATATCLVTRAFDPSPAYGQVAFAAVLSWIIGFIIVPVPGGIGVREAAFAAAATSLPDDVAATVAIMARLCFIVADLVGAGLIVALHAGQRGKTDTADAGELVA